MEVHKKAIYYVYFFDDFIDLSQVSEENPLVINFLGRYLKIIEVFPETNGIKIDLGDEIKTYINGDPYIDEDELSPDWKWYITNLDVTDKTTTIENYVPNPPDKGVINASADSGPVIAIYNYFRTISSSDSPAGVGECYSLPNNYAEICLDSLTVADNDYTDYQISYEIVDLSNVYPSFTAEPVIVIKKINPGFGLGVILPPYQVIQATNKLYLRLSDVDLVEVYTENLYGEMTKRDPDIPLSDSLFYFAKPTNDGGFNGDIQFNLWKDIVGGDVYLNLQILGEAIQEVLEVKLGYDEDGFTGIGDIASEAESSEISWADAYSMNPPTQLGKKDEDHRSIYGIIIKDPKSNGAQDKVILQFPEDQVQANVNVNGPSSAIVSMNFDSNVINGREFDVYININSQNKEIYAGQFELYFDSDDLKVVSVSEGSFLNSDGVDTYPVIDIQNGKVVFGNTRLNVNDGIIGSGDLAVIKFEAKSAGTTFLDFNNVELVDDEANPIVIFSQNKNIDISNLQGDVNNDAVVDIVDLATVGQAFGSEFGSANYNADADLNSDSKINIFDLAIVGMNFGK